MMISERRLANINVNLFGKIMKALFDTGALISIIRESILKGNSLIKESKNIRVASDAVVKSRGKLNIRIIIKEKTFETKVEVVKDLVKPLILGLDFLKKNNSFGYRKWNIPLVKEDVIASIEFRKGIGKSLRRRR